MKSLYRIESEIHPDDRFDTARILAVLSSVIEKEGGVLKSKVNRTQEVFEGQYLFQKQNSLR
jgi:hypothetical protein